MRKVISKNDLFTEVLGHVSGRDGPDRRGGGDLFPGNTPRLFFLTVIQEGLTKYKSFETLSTYRHVYTWRYSLSS